MKQINTLLKWIALIIFAIVILTVFVPPAFIIGVIAKFWRRSIGKAMDEFSGDLKATAIVLDILGCVTIFNWLWFLFKKKHGYKFGSINDTVSYVLHRNYKDGTLTDFGLWLYNTINRADKGHFEIFEK